MTRHQQIIAAYQSGMPVRALLQQFAINGKPISRQRLHQHLKKAGVKSRIQRSRDIVLASAQDARSLRELASTAGCATGTAKLALIAADIWPETMAQFAAYRDGTPPVSTRMFRVGEQIKALAAALDRTPSLLECGHSGIPVKSVLRAAGGYSKFVASLGLTPNWKRKA